MAEEDGDVPIQLKVVCLLCVHSMIKITGQRLGIDGTLVSDDGSKPEVLSVIIRDTAAALANLQLDDITTYLLDQCETDASFVRSIFPHDF